MLINRKRTYHENIAKNYNKLALISSYNICINIILAASDRAVDHMEKGNLGTLTGLEEQNSALQQQQNLETNI